MFDGSRKPLQQNIDETAALAELAHGAGISCEGEIGFVGHAYDVIAEWQKVAHDVRGHSIPGGHFLAEESPGETCDALITFFHSPYG